MYLPWQVHHWLNRFGASLAQQMGIATIDYTRQTLAQQPLMYDADDHVNHHLPSLPSPSISPCACRYDADDHVNRHPKLAEAQEGDVYHGYRAALLAPSLLNALAEACCPPVPQSWTPA